LERRRPWYTYQFARVERLFAFRDVGQQNIHERVLTVERRTTPVLGHDNPLNRREIEFA
jgi:hypothetical protein